jgi:hypothetical protein
VYKSFYAYPPKEDKGIAQGAEKMEHDLNPAGQQVNEDGQGQDHSLS